MIKEKTKVFSIIIAIFFIWQINAQSTPIEALYQYTLPNGLKIFIAENNTVPLTYIEVAIKCGAFTQEKDTAGLFHLYEHMMFKGNSLYTNAAAITKALSDMGVSNWNGSTDIECVNYYFTVPSEKTEEGLQFWSAAIREPLLDKKELDNEKKVVLSEIKADETDPSHILQRARCKILFPGAPYKLSPGGDKNVVKKATVEQLREIQSKYYVPGNAAIFIGGDVTHDKVFKMVKDIYGTWGLNDNDNNASNIKGTVAKIKDSAKNDMSEGDALGEKNKDGMIDAVAVKNNEGIKDASNAIDTNAAKNIDDVNKNNVGTSENNGDTNKTNTDKNNTDTSVTFEKDKGGEFFHPKSPLKKTVMQVMPFEKMSNAIFQLNISFRGPDGELDKDDTYIADVITSALSDPASSFIQKFFLDAELGILGPDYIWGSYPTSRRAGVFSFGSVMKVAGDTIDKKVNHFIELLNDTLSHLDEIISDDDIKKVGTQLLDSDTYSSQTAKGLLGTLRFWWVTMGEEYYYNYRDDLLKVTRSDIKRFVEKYFIDKKPLVTVLLNPEVYKLQKSRLKYAGFIQVK